jgi:hypothetical protein
MIGISNLAPDNSHIKNAPLTSSAKRVQFNHNINYLG